MPSLSDLLSMGKRYFQDALPGGSLNREWTPENVRTAAEIVSMTPTPMGDAASAGLTIADLMEGNYGDAALNGLGLLPFVPAMGGVMMHRGISGAYDPNYKQAIEWFSKDKKLAKEYGSNIISKDIEPKYPAELGFRDFNTEVKFSDVTDRIKRLILDSFNSGQLPKEKAMDLFDKADSATKSGYKKVHQWLMESPDAAELLKEAGYDSIKHVERGADTYGIIK